MGSISREDQNSSKPLLGGIDVPDGDPIAVVDGVGENHPITYLSWDTEGGNRVQVNLLRSTIALWARREGSWHETHGTESGVTLAATREGACITLRVETHGRNIDRVRVVVPFNPRSAATTFIPSGWSGPNEMTLPGIISAPDFGQMLLSTDDTDSVRVSLFGRRADEHTIDLHLEWPVDRPNMLVRFSLKPSHLPAPDGMQDEELWRAVRRGWFNMLQPSAEWGTPGGTHWAAPGLLANNVISDPVSCVLYMIADHVLLNPVLAPGINATVALRRTVDWWLDNGVSPNGEMTSWRVVHGMLDANASPIIAAWDYTEAANDLIWASQRIGDIEFLADYLAKRDLNGDGLVESVYSGNYGTQIGRLGASAFDTINSGYEDAYLNALTYRAWRCLADIERKLGRDEPADRYAQLANRLRASYQGRFYNSKTGWLAWWISKDGQMHDLCAPFITSIAIIYGLVDPEPGGVMLLKLWEKIQSAGFARFDLGLPLTLEPVRKGEYAQPAEGGETGTYGRPSKEDGSDTFQQYLNGGCCVNDAYHFMTALYIVGESEKANYVLSAMLKRQVEGAFENGGGFQNGVIDKVPFGAEFYDWNGNTTGYEGHLVYSFSFLQTVLLRVDEIRTRILRPLFE
ncbi:MAG: hypothetical protein HN368_04415 [Spirochaetales bacterium]|jgi:hypothetical protein|nr:hypothetical protein [Spirochaetales bacterium]